ncbi:40S ribosome biogenesis [Komagataella phaffii CBS 7435]|uniref:Essential nucleolar protein required for 40S ribosome biogenesis n=2 Tax=Komagataella phaffii TaxID=460519 RepID=C4QXF5_KOMPG|nr:Essential nucleolar protein required for 40S ribosome biogenesis [Komagataella phaffii GS115]AOA61598.1 GQ67_02086T0 [Komagataella phaffii]CAH2446741.1 40S ribosome biogenesis [Komagataella phaffii CBS 7435]AOA66245.1 GQ68_02101T0 [Komagataella phaffii GS115]CAY67928.1 Essential nucleolar protein required for 40S ribosome biogenesis [Komagataella phaffii GS115]CCA37006.1 40S ribosome biogenesis [Komagataella phaffii CBS 7435]
MARKSAAKKAKLAAQKSGNQKSVTETSLDSKDGQQGGVDISKKQHDDSEDQEESEEDNSSESSSDLEDEVGDLITDEVEQGINKVLSAIKSNDKSLFDPNVRFFEDPEKAVEKLDLKKEYKPLYLKDYHRKNLLGEAQEFEDGEKPYVIEQRDERDKLLNEIKKEVEFSGRQENEDSDEDEDDDFLKRKENERTVEAADDLPDPSENQEEFLDKFISNQAWIPKEADKEIDMEEDDEEFDEAVEQFEQAYNFRYEDPHAAEIVTYARDQATLRRGQTNSRKKQREIKKQQKLEEKQNKEKALQQKKLKKINLVTDRLMKIKREVGEGVSEDLIKKVFGEDLMNDDFNDADWDQKMSQIFDHAYYQAEVTKPTWDDDDEIMGESYNNDEEHSDEGSDSEEEEDNINADELESVKLKEKGFSSDKAKTNIKSKNEKQSIKETAEKIVTQNSSKLLDELDEERGRTATSSDTIKFTYREVSPESFGLSNRDILIADDSQLNQFIGIKKLAPYREKDQRDRDKRKYGRQKRLGEWREKVFKDFVVKEDGDGLRFRKKRKHK